MKIGPWLRQLNERTDEVKEATEDTLRSEYEEVCKSHQAITDFRGRLLGLLPLASGAGILLLLDRQGATPGTTLLVAVGLFGAAVTLGLYFYERRGMVECLVLRKRGENLERALHISEDQGHFQNNTPGFVGPQGAGPIVYFAVMAAWLFVGVHGFSLSRPQLEWRLGVLILVMYLIAMLIASLDFRYRLKSVGTRTKEAGQ